MSRKWQLSNSQPVLAVFPWQDSDLVKTLYCVSFIAFHFEQCRLLASNNHKTINEQNKKHSISKVLGAILPKCQPSKTLEL